MKNVLIVEPDLAYAMSYLGALVGTGFHTEHVTSIGKALAALNTFRADVVLLSLRPHDSRPLKLLGELRSTPRTKMLPVVAFAREDVGSLMDTARLEGATECLILGRAGAEQLVSAVRRIVMPPSESPAAPAPKAAPAALSSPTPPPAAAASAPKSVPKPVPAPAKTPPPTGKGDRASHKNVSNQGPDPIHRLKALARNLIGTYDSTVIQQVLRDLHHNVQTFAFETKSGQSEFAASLVEVLLALLQELADNPRRVSPSNGRTILQAIDGIEALAKQPPDASPSPVAEFKILGADDEVGIRNLVIRSLALAQLTPDYAKNALEALELAGRKRYDLFILDVNMPGLDGFQLCKKLRALPSYKTTPVVFVTGSDTFESRVLSAGSGGNDFIRKPFLPKELAVKALIHLLPRHPSPASK
jgi:DNA-binding response OmpR family regulator